MQLVLNHREAETNRRAHVTSCQSPGFLKHPPKPLHAERAPAPGRAPDQPEFGLNRLTNTKGPAGWQALPVGIDEHLTSGCADSHDKDACPMLAYCLRQPGAIRRILVKTQWRNPDVTTDIHPCRP